MDSKGRGRPPAKILTDHFTQIEKVGNQSNRWYYRCNYCGPDGKGARIENRDNKALKHLLVNQDCPNCPQSVRNIVRTHLASKSVDVFLAEPVQVTVSAGAKNGSASEASTSSGDVKVVKRPRTLIGFADAALTTTQQDRANFKLFRLAFISKHGHELLTCIWARFIVHANIPLSAAENWYFRSFMDEIRPSYNVPSRYVLTHSIMDAELCRVQIEEIARLKERKRLTFLIDGWEDKLKRSLYGSLAAEVNKYPVVLNLGDMTGCRGSATGLMETAERALKTMEVEDGENFIAITTDNPTVMQAFRRRFREKFYWVLVSDF